MHSYSFAYAFSRLPEAGTERLSFDLWPGSGELCFALVNAVEERGHETTESHAAGLPPRSCSPEDRRIHIGGVGVRRWEDGDPAVEPQFRAPKAVYRRAVEAAIQRGNALASSLRKRVGRNLPETGDSQYLYDYDAAAGSLECLVAPEAGERCDAAATAPPDREGAGHSVLAASQATSGLESVGGLARSLYADIVRATLAAYERPKSVSRLATSVYDELLDDLLSPGP